MRFNRHFILLLLFILLLSPAISLDLKTGTIYKVQCQITGKVYIGRTTIGTDKAIQSILLSLACYKRGMRKYNQRAFEVFANELYNVTVLDELYKLANDTDFSLTLRKRQRFHLEQQNDAVNKHIPSRTLKEYYEDNKEAHSFSQKENYQRVKHLLNKTIVCELCGEEYSSWSAWGHFRSIHHLTALAKLSSASGSSPQHQQQTLDNLLNSVMQTCDVCGVECTKIGFADHIKSIRHLTALAKLNSGSESGPLFDQQLNALLDTQMVKCDVCGVECTKVYLPRHKKTLRHLTALAKLNTGPEPESGFSPQNQQQLSDLLSTGKVTCEVCGVMCTQKSYLRHTRTKRHRDALASLTQSNGSL